MDFQRLTAREQLQYLYELAFFPPRLSEFWMQVKQAQIPPESAAAAIRGALLLHLALPEGSGASARALKRLAHYQACSKPFVPVAFLKNIARKMNLDVAPHAEHVPPEMVRDIGLPAFGRSGREAAPRVAESR